ncbi:hypothetical protein [Streptomyces sp. H34-S4]|uniref:hypothetical protein n=1 Tax=Streptomyces sp. H34-S4 TaxID=2996463 RepID=UPI002D1E4761|nr:hypothetical protein [Streptomyces sp. H34-S4]
MPPDAHCVPFDARDGYAAGGNGNGNANLGGSAYAARPARLHPELRDWAAEIAAGHDAGVRVSLRIEVDPDAEPPVFRAVLQMHGLADATLVADAADVWAGSGPTAAAFPPRARLDALRALRRAARLWPPLSPPPWAIQAWTGRWWRWSGTTSGTWSRSSWCRRRGWRWPS